MSDPFKTEIEAPKALLQEFREGAQAKVALAAIKQQKLNAINRTLAGSSRLMDGIGQLKYRIDPHLFFFMRHTFGEDCWNDKDFLHCLELDGVIQRVKGISDKIIIQARPNADFSRITYRPKTKGIIVGGKYQKIA